MFIANCSLQDENDLLMFIRLHFYIQIQCVSGGLSKNDGKISLAPSFGCEDELCPSIPFPFNRLVHYVFQLGV